MNVTNTALSKFHREPTWFVAGFVRFCVVRFPGQKVQMEATEAGDSPLMPRLRWYFSRCDSQTPPSEPLVHDSRWRFGRRRLFQCRHEISQVLFCLLECQTLFPGRRCFSPVSGLRFIPDPITKSAGFLALRFRFPFNPSLLIRICVHAFLLSLRERSCHFNRLQR